MKFHRVILGSFLALSIPVSASAAQSTTSPGKNSVFVAESAGSLGIGGDITYLSGTIVKGKKKTVLHLVGTVSVNAAASVLGTYVVFTVNGVVANPVAASQSPCIAAQTANCSTTGDYWLDIDAAELANPGLFVGQPLVVVLIGGNTDIAGTGVPYRASFSAQVTKK